MKDVLKPILENDLLNEEAREQIQEAFNAKIEEVRRETEDQLREEFAGRYENDKDILVQAVENMVGEGLKAEVAEFHEDRNRLTEQQVKLANEIREARTTAKNELNEKLAGLEQFVLNTLAEELKDFAQDRGAVREAKKDLAKQVRESRVAYKQQLTEKISVLENFVLNQLKGEIGEFQQDKQSLLDQRVKMIAEGKDKIEQTRKEFVKRASNLVETRVKDYLQEEIGQFREDIEASRQKSFGQKLFDEFAAEFKASFFNENAEVRKLRDQLTEANKMVKKAGRIVTEAKENEGNSKRRQQLAESRAERTVITTELLGKLSGKNRDVMAELLESVKTENLKASFRRFVPAVTSGTGETLLNRRPIVEDAKTATKTMHTGNRKNTLVESKQEATEEETAEVLDLKRLAGI